MSYHSLEDRMTKQVLADATRLDVPPDLPVVPDELRPELRLVTRGAEQADAAEVAENPRAQSVRVRAAERVRPRGSKQGSTHGSRHGGKQGSRDRHGTTTRGRG
jgi:16S rRNA (cytosine1402-N4)-methyltransferase